MQTLPGTKNTITRIAEAAETFRATVENVQLEKKFAKSSTDIDSILKMASLFAESTMT
jgi:hypothetical protein